MLQQAEQPTKGSRRTRIVAIGAAAMLGGSLLGVAPANATTAERQVAHHTTAATGTHPDAVQGKAAAKRTAAKAIAWYSKRKGSTAYEGSCEKAARLSWARKTHHASAIAHWKSSDGARHTKGTPPKGAFVFWNISSYGHVGIADGKGGFWATDVSSAIGHRGSVHYFSHYLGWKRGNSH